MSHSSLGAVGPMTGPKLARIGPPAGWSVASNSATIQIVTAPTRHSSMDLRDAQRSLFMLLLDEGVEVSYVTATDRDDDLRFEVGVIGTTARVPAIHMGIPVNARAAKSAVVALGDARVAA